MQAWKHLLESLGCTTGKKKITQRELKGMLTIPDFPGITVTVSPFSLLSEKRFAYSEVLLRVTG